MASVLTHRLDIAEAPAIQGEHGRAWIVRIKPARKDQEAALRAWIVEAPWAHPLWHSYQISVVHLRDIPGVVAATIIRPGATHEMSVIALDPQHPVDLDHGPIHWLHPLNFVGQWRGESDEAAILKVRDCVLAICAGKLSPDTDFRSAWVAIFGGAA